MRVTIGEMINEVSKYSNLVEARIVGSTPTVHAFISTKTGITRIYLNIAQVAPHLYSACADTTNLDGMRFIATGSVDRPFVRELEVIHGLYGGSGPVERPSNNVDYAPYPKMMIYLLNLLVDNDLISLPKKMLDTRLSTLGFNNAKISRSLEKAFIVNHARTGTIQDLFMIVSDPTKKFVLEGLRAKDIKYVTCKLKSMGVQLVIDDNGKVLDIIFDRR